MYDKILIIVANLTKSKYFEANELKIIERYEKIDTENVVVRVKAVFKLAQPLPLELYIPVIEGEF